MALCRGGSGRAFEDVERVGMVGEEPGESDDLGAGDGFAGQAYRSAPLLSPIRRARGPRGRGAEHSDVLLQLAASVPSA
jgi:hypothetical protein